LIVHVHAIGDRAVKEALDGIAAARKANGNSGLPHTITHEQFVQPEDFPRFGTGRSERIAASWRRQSRHD